MKKSSVIAIVLLVITVGYIYIRSSNRKDNMRYETTYAQMRDIEQSIIVSGAIEPLKEIDIKSTISGVLEELLVKVGDDVTMGQPIARVQYVKDPMEYKRLVNELDRAKTRLENAQTSFDRIQKLFDNEVVSAEEYESSLNNLKLVKSEYETTSSELNMLKGKYEGDMVSNIIKATNNGTILDLPVKEGGSVMARGTLSEGSTIARIADMRQLVFKGDVPENDVLKLHVGMDVTCSMIIRDDMEIGGTLSLIAPKGTITSGIAYYEVTADLQIPDSCRSSIKAGCTANMHIVTDRRSNVVALDEKYFQFSYDSVYVEVHAPDNTFKRRDLTLGISDGIYTEIVAGLDTLDEIKVN